MSSHLFPVPQMNWAKLLAEVSPTQTSALPALKLKEAKQIKAW